MPTRHSDADHVCTLSVEGPDLPRRVFDERYRALDRPVVIRNASLTSSASFRAATTIAALSADFGQATVTLSSANAFSYGRQRKSVSEYLNSMSGAAWDKAAAEDDGGASTFCTITAAQTLWASAAHLLVLARIPLTGWLSTLLQTGLASTATSCSLCSSVTHYHYTHTQPHPSLSHF